MTGSSTARADLRLDAFYPCRQNVTRLLRLLVDRIDLRLALPTLPNGKIVGATIDADARPPAGPDPLPFRGATRGHSAVFWVSDP